MLELPCTPLRFVGAAFLSGDLSLERGDASVDGSAGGSIRPKLFGPKICSSILPSFPIRVCLIGVCISVSILSRLCELSSFFNISAPAKLSLLAPFLEVPPPLPVPMLFDEVEAANLD